MIRVCLACNNRHNSMCGTCSNCGNRFIDEGGDYTDIDLSDGLQYLTLQKLDVNMEQLKYTRRIGNILIFYFFGFIFILAGLAITGYYGATWAKGILDTVLGIVEKVL